MKLHFDRVHCKFNLYPLSFFLFVCFLLLTHVSASPFHTSLFFSFRFQNLLFCFRAVPLETTGPRFPLSPSSVSVFSSLFPCLCLSLSLPFYFSASLQITDYLQDVMKTLPSWADSHIKTMLINKCHWNNIYKNGLSKFADTDKQTFQN